MNSAAPNPKPKTIPNGFHASWADVDMTAWRWPHFTPKELSCRCGGKHCRGEYFHNPDFLDRLEDLRSWAGSPLTVTSGRRCKGHNAAVGGATRSQHMLAIATDISLMNHDPLALARSAVRAGFNGIGFGASFVHVDMRATRTAFHYPDGKAAWTKRFGFDPVIRLQRTWSLS